MNESLWIYANLEGRARWYIAVDRGDSVYFPEITGVHFLQSLRTGFRLKRNPTSMAAGWRRSDGQVGLVTRPGRGPGPTKYVTW